MPSLRSLEMDVFCQDFCELLQGILDGHAPHLERLAVWTGGKEVPARTLEQVRKLLLRYDLWKVTFFSARSESLSTDLALPALLSGHVSLSTGGEHLWNTLVSLISHTSTPLSILG